MHALRALIHLNRSSKIIIQNRLIERLKYINGMKKSMSTVNTEEVEHFHRMKSDWWDKNGVLKPLHSFNPLRVQFVREGLVNTGLIIQNPYLPLEGIKIADVGCGGGIFTENLARVGAQVTGIDPSVELIDIAREHMELDPEISERITYVHTSIEEFSKGNEDLYDAVVSSEVLEHVEEQEIFLKKCVKIIRPGGSVFITTINKTAPSWLLAIVAAEYIMKILPVGTHDWNKFISPDNVQRILDNYGCKTNLIHGILYNPLINQWSWSSCTTINYGLHAIKNKDGK